MDIIYKNSKVVTMPIYLDWANIGKAVVKAGAPISAAGRVANSGSAIGVLMNDTGIGDGNHAATIITAGVLDLPSIQSSFGSNLTDGCKRALDDICFIKSDGTPDTSSSGLTETQVQNRIESALADYTPTESLPDVVYPGILLKSTTEGSEKVFIVTVDDDGTLTATDTAPEPEGDPEGEPEGDPEE